ncbi:hypothetical protein V5O48_011630 [Marasmius crinis-equi]|uniref:Uncharacterized protein n=1 Tax=Marasmius crinis-equi TaxID=585013 RepID=A0ABR3F512_9AGAR
MNGSLPNDLDDSYMDQDSSQRTVFMGDPTPPASPAPHRQQDNPMFQSFSTIGQSDLAKTLRYHLLYQDPELTIDHIVRAVEYKYTPGQMESLLELILAASAGGRDPKGAIAEAKNYRRRCERCEEQYDEIDNTYNACLPLSDCTARHKVKVSIN